MAGDFYRQLGRGIALAIRKVDELGLDVGLRGGEATWAGESAEFSVFGGITNSVNIDSVNQKHIADPQDVIAGAQTEVMLSDEVRVGAYGLYMQPKEALSEEVDLVATGGGSVELQLMDSDLVLYMEGVGQHRETAGISDVGYAAYLSMDLIISDWTLLIEGLFMEAFEQKGSTNTAINNRFNYSNAPTLERFDQEVLNNRDVAGVRARAETSFLDGDLRVHGSLMYRITDPLDEFVRVDQLHAFAGAEYLWDYGDSRLAGSAGYRSETQAFSGNEIKGMIHADIDYIQRLNEALSLHITSVNEFRTLLGNPYERGSLFLGVDWANVGGLTFEFGYDTQNKADDARNLFYAGIIVAHLSDRMELRGTIGTQRGGIKCIAGVCRQFPSSPVDASRRSRASEQAALLRSSYFRTNAGNTTQSAVWAGLLPRPFLSDVSQTRSMPRPKHRARSTTVAQELFGELAGRGRTCGHQSGLPPSRRWPWSWHLGAVTAETPGQARAAEPPISSGPTETRPARARPVRSALRAPAVIPWTERTRTLARTQARTQATTRARTQGRTRHDPGRTRAAPIRGRTQAPTPRGRDDLARGGDPRGLR